MGLKARDVDMEEGRRADGGIALQLATVVLFACNTTFEIDG